MTKREGAAPTSDADSTARDFDGDKVCDDNDDDDDNDGILGPFDDAMPVFNLPN